MYQYVYSKGKLIHAIVNSESNIERARGPCHQGDNKRVQVRERGGWMAHVGTCGALISRVHLSRRHLLPTPRTICSPSTHVPV